MASLSFSSFSMFKSCPKKYAFKYKERRKVPKAVNVRNFLPGSMVHKVIEKALIEAKPITLELAEKIAPVTFEEVVKDQTKNGEVILYYPGENLESLKEDAKELLKNTVELIRKYELDVPGVLNEHWFGNYKKPFQLEPGIDITGAADFIKDHGQHLSIYDSKTSKDKTYLDTDQLCLYGICAEKEFNKPVREVGFLMIRWNKLIREDFTPTFKEDFLGRFRQSCTMIDKGIFNPTPSATTCGNCDFSSICSASAKNMSTKPSTPQILPQNINFTELFN